MRRALAGVLLAAPAWGQLPEAMTPPGNPITPNKVRLGKALFWEEQLSAHDGVACGTCHRPSAGGSDPRVATHFGPDGEPGTDGDRLGSPGTPGRVTPRRPRSVLAASYGFELFWDGRATERFLDPLSGDVVLKWGAALETQALAPILHPDEMGAPGWGWPEVTRKLASVRPLALSPDVPGPLARWVGERGYPALFAEAFGDADITPARIAQAIASYERTLVPELTPVLVEPDGGERWTHLEREGLKLFKSLNCAVCHPPEDGLFTDLAYHFLGTSPLAADDGLAGVTGLREDRGNMLTPSLLGVALRAPFFHDGSQATLRDVVEFYDRGGDHEPNEIGRLNLTELEKEALVAFLGGPLTDPRLIAETPPFDRPLLTDEQDPRPRMAAGILHLTSHPFRSAGLFTWSGQRADPGITDDGYLPVEFPIPQTADLIGVTIEADWVGALGARDPRALRVRFQVTPPR
ncbi:MAG: hypothetical protein O2816_15725 [Planctomycetota bacterium]|nr:hypothetical protein [Planctomycetota bacterium]